MSAAAGFFGKMPSRGDFVRGGLPPGLVRAMDSWWQAVLPGSQVRLGADWPATWMEAPVWRFHLPPGRWAPGPVLGLWLPSTDRVGRLFPLVVAATGTEDGGLRGLGGFLDAAEAVALSAIEHDPAPDQVEAAIAQVLAGALAGAAGDPAVPPAPAPGYSTWWTAGSRLVSPACRHFPALPDAASFTAMLRDPEPGEAVTLS